VVGFSSGSPEGSILLVPTEYMGSDFLNTTRVFGGRRSSMTRMVNRNGKQAGVTENNFIASRSGRVALKSCPHVGGHQTPDTGQVSG